MLMNHRLPMTVGQALMRAADVTVGRLLLPIRRVYGAIRHRRHIAVLAELDASLLVDIGLTRDDVRDAMRQPIWRDPTELLAVRAGAVRAKRRAAAWRGEL